MFFALLCLLLLGLLGFGVHVDPYGWMMLVATGWFCGYLDGRLFRKSDTDSDRVMPPDHDAIDTGSDQALFEDR